MNSLCPFFLIFISVDIQFSLPHHSKGMIALILCTFEFSSSGFQSGKYKVT